MPVPPRDQQKTDAAHIATHKAKTAETALPERCPASCSTPSPPPRLIPKACLWAAQELRGGECLKGSGPALPKPLDADAPYPKPLQLERVDGDEP